MPQQPPGWHPEDIKAALRKRFGPLGTLSRTWGLHRCAISNALGDPSYSVQTELRIALVLGVKPQVLWPDRWDAATGKSLPRPGKTDRKSKPVVFTSQKERAA